MLNNSKIQSYSSKGFFGFVFRQNWQQFMLYIITTLLVMVAPAYLFSADCARRIASYTADGVIQEEITVLIKRNIGSISAIGIMLGLGIAVFAGMSTLSYVNSKVNTGCYHSLPVTRASIYFSETATRIIYYLISAVTGFVTSYLIIIARIPESAQFFTDYVIQFVIALVSFFLIYSIFMLSAGVTGTAPMRFLMTIAISFLPVLMYLLFIASAALQGSVDIDQYVELNVIKWLSAPIALSDNMTAFSRDRTLLPMIMSLLTSVAFYFSGLLLHVFRKSESSGVTVIWKPILYLVKYGVVFVASVISMFLFSIAFLITSDQIINVRIIIGAVIGAVISNMLMNCILYKSTKAIFRDIKSFIAMLVAIVLFCVFIPINAAGLVEKIFPPDDTVRIAFHTTDGKDIIYADRDDINEILDLLDKEINEDTSKIRNIDNIYGDTEDFIWKYFTDYYDSTYNEKRSQYYNHKVSYVNNVKNIDYSRYMRFGTEHTKRLIISCSGDLWEYI